MIDELQGFYDSVPPTEEPEDIKISEMLYTFEHLGIMHDLLDKTIKYNFEDIEDWYERAY